MNSGLKMKIEMMRLTRSVCQTWKERPRKEPIESRIETRMGGETFKTRNQNQDLKTQFRWPTMWQTHSKATVTSLLYCTGCHGTVDPLLGLVYTLLWHLPLWTPHVWKREERVTAEKVKSIPSHPILEYLPRRGWVWWDQIKMMNSEMREFILSS